MQWETSHRLHVEFCPTTYSRIMGRSKERKDLKGRRGPGRKTKKQSEPGLPSSVAESNKSDPVLDVKHGKVGGRIKQRVRKRALLLAAAKAARDEHIRRKQERRKRAAVIKGSSSNEEWDTEVVFGENVKNPPVFSDETNKSWLKPVKSILKSPGQPSPKTAKKVRVSLGKQDLLSGGSDGNSSDQGKCKVSVIVL